MRTSFVVRAALLAALSTPAMAMDASPVFETLPPPAAPAARDWTGFYGGPSASNPWNRVPYDTLIAGAPVASGTATPSGAPSNLQLGYNYQSGWLVFGLEGDLAWRHGMDSVLLSPTGLDNLNLRNDQGWIGTLRPRMGVAADNWLLYASAGLAYGDTDTLAGANRTGSDASARAGWTGGAGVEYAAGKRWSLGLEYLYADFGKAPLSSTALGPLSSPAQTHLLRGRLNYQFDWDIPRK